MFMVVGRLCCLVQRRCDWRLESWSDILESCDSLTGRVARGGYVSDTGGLSLNFKML